MILGIDPGLENTGWAVVDGEKLVECGVILTNPKKKSAERLEEVYNQVTDIIEKYKVSEMAWESLFFAKNAKSAIKVAEAIGVVKLAGRKAKLEMAEYTPLQVKMALVGYGRAEKDQVEVMVKTFLGRSEPITPSHASDAVAVALTHVFTLKL
jgi:crossover junction endodeoxyribonuclease RuvC